MRAMILAGFACAALAGCGDSNKSAPFDQAKWDQGAKSYERRCAGCHHSPWSGNKGSKTGPHIADLDGRKAASIRGFDYSKAMRQSKIKWDATTLDSFMKRPKTYILGTKMVIDAITDEAERAALSYFIFTKKP